MAWKLNGPSHEVHGLSAAWAQALNLKDEAKLDSGRAIAGWLLDIEKGRITLNPSSLVLLDEAGMVGVRDMRNVIKAVQDAGAKIVLMGDTLQQSSVCAGDALRVLVKEYGSVRLDKIRRQKKESDRLAVYEFFAGNASDALDRYKARITICKDNESTDKVIVDAWIQSRIQNPDKSHLILALDNKSVRDINALAHQARKDAGQLGKDAVKLFTMDSEDRDTSIHGKDTLIEFSVGDEVVFRNNVKGISVKDEASLKVAAEFTSGIKRLADIDYDLRVVNRRPAGPEKEMHLLKSRQSFASHYRSMESHFSEIQNEFGQEIDMRMKAQRELKEGNFVQSMRSHSVDVHERIQAAEKERANHVHNRVRGVIEKIDVKTQKITIRNEDRKLVEFNPSDKSWQHRGTKRAKGEESGLAIQHAYACSMSGSQGLGRDKVFGKDHPGMNREQIGVTASRHKEDYFHFVDKEARYAAAARHMTYQEEMGRPISKFTDEECIKQMKATYSREGGKASTLDYGGWRDGAGQELYPDAELALAQIDNVRKLLSKAEDQMLNIRTAGVPKHAIEECPFQLNDRYVLPEPVFKDAIAKINAPVIGQERLRDDGIDQKVIDEAKRQGFMTFFEEGGVGFNGVRPSDKKVVNRIRDGQLEAGIFRGQYPPILKGNSREVHLVRSGEDALALWSNCNRVGITRPTVIVTHDSVREATCLKHVRDILAGSENAPVIHTDKRHTAKESAADLRNLSAVSKKAAVESKDGEPQIEKSKALEAASIAQHAEDESLFSRSSSSGLLYRPIA